MPKSGGMRRQRGRRTPRGVNSVEKGLYNRDKNSKHIVASLAQLTATERERGDRTRTSAAAVDPSSIRRARAVPTTRVNVVQHYSSTAVVHMYRYSVVPSVSWWRRLYAPVCQRGCNRETAE